jgi:uncharacterized pyridoxamine 5'-phosphate oxidase family protein
MRALLVGLTVIFLLGNEVFFLHAQTNTNANIQPCAPQSAHENPAIAFLTPAQQIQYATVHAKALADNPALKAEGESILKQGDALTANSTAADRQAFMEKMNSHRQKLRQAMLKEDPTLEPIFVEIDKHISELKAKQLGQVQDSPGKTNTPTAAH